MTLPTFPETRPITQNDKQHLDGLFTELNPQGCELTFAHIFAWSAVKNIVISQYKGCTLILYKDLGPAFLPTIPPEHITGPYISGLASEALRAGFLKPHIWRVPLSLYKKIPRSKRYPLLLERDQADYVYRASDLKDLPGRRYDGKRNHIKQFLKQYTYSVQTLTHDNEEKAAEFCCRWCREQKTCTQEMRHDLCATLRMVRMAGSLNLTGYLIHVNGAIAALTIGEKLNDSTFVVHVEKADTNIKGAYQMINKICAERTADLFTYINREQDLGVPGLRKAKLSYHPSFLVEKGTINML